jgi:hypothetical protein
MLKLVRAPLTWMVLAEILVVAALVALAWHVVAGASSKEAASPALAQPADGSVSPSPPSDLPQANRPAVAAPLPGLNLDTAFWRQRLDEMNREQVFFEELEWRVVHSAVDAMQRYLETVVVPAVRRAEHARS